MKKILLFFISSIFFIGGFGQNLVSNGSFEIKEIPCVTSQSGIIHDYCKYWYGDFDYNGTPDLYNSCDTLPVIISHPLNLELVSVPNNSIGFQSSRTGYNYSGFCTTFSQHSGFDIFYYREILSSKLICKLDSGVNYSYRMYVSVAKHSNIYLDGLGASLCNDSVIKLKYTQGNLISSNLADISFKGNGFLKDTLNWFNFEGTFRSDGTEDFLHIADLDSLKSPSEYQWNGIDYYDGSTLYTYIAYYYIDDVALWRADDSTYISSDIGQTDTTICYGDSILLGSYQYDETYYRWEKITHAGQDIKSVAVYTNKVGWAEQHDLPIYFQREQIYDSAFVWVKPTKTTTYILETTNCIFEKTYDTVVVTVQKCGPNAGMDTAVCRNSTLVLGGIDNIGYSCQWYPNTFLSSDTAAMPTMTATQSMMYYLSISDASGVIKTDSIYVIAGDCYYSVEVRDDTIICKGDTVHLGKHTYTGAQYEWTPNWLLNNNTIDNPYCLADSTILYTLKLTDIVGNISYDSVLVGVTICPGLLPSAPLSQRVKAYPNPAKEQITFELLDCSKRNNEISIFNSMGAIVYNENFNSDIKKINTSKFKSGIYFYRIVDSEKRSMLGKFIVF